MADSDQATVTGVASVVTPTPLTILADGASVSSPAESLDGATYIAGDRVAVTFRDPQWPLVTGKVETA